MLMLRRFGPRTQTEVMARADALHAQKGQDGYRLWLKVCAAVDEMRSLVGPKFRKSAT